MNSCNKAKTVKVYSPVFWSQSQELPMIKPSTTGIAIRQFLYTTTPAVSLAALPNCWGVASGFVLSISMVTGSRYFLYQNFTFFKNIRSWVEDACTLQTKIPLWSVSSLYLWLQSREPGILNAAWWIRCLRSRLPSLLSHQRQKRSLDIEQPANFIFFVIYIHWNHEIIKHKKTYTAHIH